MNQFALQALDEANTYARSPYGGGLGNPCTVTLWRTRMGDTQGLHYLTSLKALCWKRRLPLTTVYPTLSIYISNPALSV